MCTHMACPLLSRSPLLTDGTVDKLKSLGVKTGMRMHLIPTLAAISAFHALLSPTLSPQVSKRAGLPCEDVLSIQYMSILALSVW